MFRKKIRNCTKITELVIKKVSWGEILLRMHLKHYSPPADSFPIMTGVFLNTDVN